MKMPKKNDMLNGTVLIAMASIGYMVANGLTNSIAKIDDENAVLTDEQKKTKLYVSLGNVGVGGALAVTQKGAGMKETALRGLGVGMGTYGGRSLISHFAKSTNVVDATGVEGGTKRFMTGALGCPCNSENYDVNNPSWTKPRVVSIPSMQELQTLRKPYSRSNSRLQRDSNRTLYTRRAS
jgi:hypothetical protein